jgi:hypothetical protein
MIFADTLGLVRSYYVLIPNDRPTRELAHADPQQMEKLASELPEGRRSPLRLPMHPSPTRIGIRCSRTLAPRPMAPR